LQVFSCFVLFSCRVFDMLCFRVGPLKHRVANQKRAVALKTSWSRSEQPPALHTTLDSLHRTDRVGCWEVAPAANDSQDSCLGEQERGQVKVASGRGLADRWPAGGQSDTANGHVIP
jgi:hypothetical protein